MAGRLPPGVPGIIMRAARPFRLAVFLLFFASLATGICALVLGLDLPGQGILATLVRPRRAAVLLFSALILGLAQWPALWVLRLRIRRLVRSASGVEYEVCINCGYFLRGLPEQGRCPECAEEYKKTTLRDEWASWFAG